MNRTPETNEGSEAEVGHVIGAAVTVFVLTFILFLGALYYVMIKYRNNNFDVSKAGLHNTSRESKYSTIPKGNGVPKSGPPSTSNSHSKATEDSTKVAR